MQVSKWLRHSTFTLTLDVYGDYIPEQDGGAANTLPEPPAPGDPVGRRGHMSLSPAGVRLRGVVANRHLLLRVATLRAQRPGSHTPRWAELAPWVSTAPRRTVNTPPS
jgi:hypothetical protein